VHRRLQKQLAARPAGPAVPEEWRPFVDAVDAAYAAADAERALLDNAVDALTALLRRAQDQQSAAEAQLAERGKRKRDAGRRRAKAQLESKLAQLELDASLVVKSANPAAAKLCGVQTGDELAGRSLFEILEPLEQERITESWQARLARLEPVAQTLACTARDGRALACDWVCTPRASREGKLVGVTVLLRDETARLEAVETLRDREQRALLGITGSGDVLWDWSLGKGTLYLSPRFFELLGLPVPPASGKPAEWFDRVHPDDLAALRAALDAQLEGREATIEHEHRVRDSEGGWRWLSVRGVTTKNAAGTPVRLCGLLTDVTRHRALVERMTHDARHDPLTGLPNRTLFLDLLRHSFNRIRRNEHYRFALLFIDIDRFKTVNDALGHQVGDELLVQIAKRLTACLRQGDTLARHAGDEFTMWLDDVHGAPDALRVADRVHEAMNEPFELGGQAIQSSASIGVAISASRYERAEEVLRDADAAMYRAKALGRARTAVFEADPAARPMGQMQLEADLRRAIVRDELRVFYLPIMGVVSGRVEGFEALARWQHPRLGLVAPPQFLPLAIETGLIASIDQWVLQTASRQLHEWRTELTEASRVSLSVNCSQRLLEQRDVASQIDRVLRDSELLPSDLNLDISESALAAGSASPGLLAELRTRGLSLHMDDFGTGQAWLRHLHGNELDSVKIDRSFVSSLTAMGGDRKVLRSIVSIAQELGKKVIAEGVETAEQLRWVREAGCDSAQGFFFSAPLDGLRARSLLQKSNATVARLA
jgi:diguanylate cyclase (GGDEF)-like protein/PAS domain S-box-containing protein